MAQRVRMTQIAKMKELASAYKRHSVSQITSLRGAYAKPSAAKCEAWADCIRTMQDFDGYGIRVLGHNCQFFSVGFFCTDPETCEPCFMYITSTKEWYASIEDIKNTIPWDGGIAL